jgi:hypothetical protein
MKSWLSSSSSEAVHWLCKECVSSLTLVVNTSWEQTWVFAFPQKHTVARLLQLTPHWQEARHERSVTPPHYLQWLPWSLLWLWHGWLLHCHSGSSLRSQKALLQCLSKVAARHHSLWPWTIHPRPLCYHWWPLLCRICSTSVACFVCPAHWFPQWFTWKILLQSVEGHSDTLISGLKEWCGLYLKKHWFVEKVCAPSL